MCKLLIAEDDKIWAKLLEKTLSSSEVEIINASDGFEAIEKLKENDIDFALIDINMPKLSGIGLVERMKRMKLKTKVAFITGLEKGNVISEFAVFMAKKGKHSVTQVFFKRDSHMNEQCKSFIQG